jgi:hypothetical protein
MRRPVFFREVIYTDSSSSGTVAIRRLVLLRTPLASVYLHRLLASDAGRDPHDHPRPFISWVLRGGYTEQYWPTPSQPALSAHRTHTADRAFGKMLGGRRWHRFEAGAAHRIVSVMPGTRTVCVFYGRRCKRGWGFYVNGAFIPHDVYREACP